MTRQCFCYTCVSSLEIMWRHHCIHLIISFLNIVCCFCFVNFELFKGFDQYNYATDHGPYQPYLITNPNATIKSSTTPNLLTKHKIVKVPITPYLLIKPKTTVRPVTTTNRTNATTLSNKTITKSATHELINITKMMTKRPSVKLKNFTKACPEVEKPSSLGTYEIPTQRDLVLYVKRTLLKMFNTYHEKTLRLLKDIHEVSRTTHEYEKQCTAPNRVTYRKCIKRVSKQCIVIVKDLVETMEKQKQTVAALIEETTCNMTDMKTDPLELIKTLAVDEASLEFALPAFLRLIGGCSSYCSMQSQNQQPIRRPSRHMTDQDLVVRHFLTRKNYIQLIKDSDAYVSGSKNAALVNWMHSAHS